MNREQQLAMIDNEQTKIELQSQAERLNILEKRIEELEELKNLPAQFFELQREMAGWSKQYSESLDQLRWRKAEQDQKIEGLNILVNAHTNDIKVLKESIGSNNTAHSDFRNSTGQMFKNIQESIGARDAAIRKDFDVKIDKLKADLVVSPAQILENNNEIKNRVEIAMLDSNNAILKSTNLETLFKVLDRRLENLTQLVKKIELGLTS